MKRASTYSASHMGPTTSSRDSRMNDKPKVNDVVDIVYTTEIMELVHDPSFLFPHLTFV